MGEGYGLEGSDHARGVLMSIWLLGCDCALKVIGRMIACSPGIDAFGTLLTDPGPCPGTALLGDAMLLQPRAHAGALLGLGAGALVGFSAQLYALALLFLAVTATILVLRWAYRAPGDPVALGALWAGAISGAVPRLYGGSGQGELAIAGLSTGVGELALLWALAWLTWRALAEWRA